jgi:hypothetical protein
VRWSPYVLIVDLRYHFHRRSNNDIEPIIMYFIIMVHCNSTVRYGTVLVIIICYGCGLYCNIEDYCTESRTMRYFNFVDLSTICPLLTASAGLLLACSSRLPPLPLPCYFARDRPSRTHHPMLFFLFTNGIICYLAR